jgi:hypothetical protein
MSKPRPEWKHLGKTENADFYELADDVIAILPGPNTKDDAKTARQSIQFQDAHWRKVGRRGAVVVFMDNVIDQDAGARTVYAEEVTHVPTTCYALVGETFYGHATAAVFEGLSKPGLPTNVFRSLEDALPWIAEMNRTRGGRV